jgi:hypothetical protein
VIFRFELKIGQDRIFSIYRKGANYERGKLDFCPGDEFSAAL